MDSPNYSQMETLEYLYNRPVQGTDALSMTSWRSDCEAEWKTLDPFLENKDPGPLAIYLNAYCDLAFKYSTTVSESVKSEEKLQ